MTSTEGVLSIGLVCNGHHIRQLFKSAARNSPSYRLNPNKALDKIPVLEMQGVNCRIMGSHGVTCQPTQVNAPALTPASKLVLDLPTPEGWKTELTYRLTGNATAGSRTRDLLIKSPTP